MTRKLLAALEEVVSYQDVGIEDHLALRYACEAAQAALAEYSECLASKVEAEQEPARRGMLRGACIR